MKERKRFVNAITGQTSKKLGVDPNVSRKTTTQKLSEEEFFRKIQRSNIIYGTPIEK